MREIFEYPAREMPVFPLAGESHCGAAFRVF
jgi:hypothetical protein